MSGSGESVRDGRDQRAPGRKAGVATVLGDAIAALGAGCAIGAIGIFGAWLPTAAVAETAASPAPGGAVQAAVQSAAQALAVRVLATADHRRLPFAIVDKPTASITVYLPDGTVAGTSSVLLGRTPGDDVVPGTGERTQAGTLRPQDLTTPAGRFVSRPGRNRSGEAIVWLDYGNAFAIHRLRPAPAGQQRAQRLASTDLRDRRISAGCVVVPEAFYDRVVQPVLGHGQGIVYVMPERGSWQARWPALLAVAAAAGSGSVGATPVSTSAPALPSSIIETAVTGPAVTGAAAITPVAGFVAH